MERELRKTDDGARVTDWLNYNNPAKLGKRPGPLLALPAPSLPAPAIARALAKVPAPKLTGGLGDQHKKAMHKLEVKKAI